MSPAHARVRPWPALRWRAALGCLALLALGALGWALLRDPAPAPTPAPFVEEAIPAKTELARAAAPNPAEVPRFGGAWAPEGMAPLVHPKPGLFEDRDFIQGAAITLSLDLPGLPYERLLSEIQQLGATHVSLVVPWAMRDIRAVHVQRSPHETVSDERLRAVIAHAHQLGLKVMLFPILHIERRRAGEWRGRLAPQDPERWWRSYEAFVLHYAQLAQGAEVDIFSVGSELLSLEHERERWSALIAKVRAAFRGRLTYSANWDHFEHVTFWADLDLAGMTGYFELSKLAEPTYADLKKTWSEAAALIATYPDKAQRPLLLTEVGYPSQRGSVAHPWDYTRRKAPDTLGQYLAFRAMYEAWSERAQALPPDQDLGLAGVFLWDWYGYGGPDDGSYTLRGKPAQAVARCWFRGQEP